MPILAGEHQDGVFLWTFEGTVDAAEFRRWFGEVRQATLAATAPRLYHVMHVTATETDFGAILSQMRDSTQNSARHSTDRPVMFIFVGTNEMAKLAANLARLPQFGGFEMPFFPTLDDAYQFIAIDRSKPTA